MKLNLNNKLWTAWLMGFLDAEGNYQVFPKKRVNVKGVITHYGVGYHFHMGLGLRDHDLLKFIMSQFNSIGEIYLYPAKKEAHYAISRKGDVLWLIENILEQYPLLTIHQSSRYNQVRNGLLNNVTRFATLEEFHAFLDSHALVIQPDISNLPQEFIDSWIVGFINGEGCFSHAAGETGAQFIIEHTDRGVLDMIRERLGIGPNVYTRASRGGRKVTYTLQFSTSTDLNKLIQFLDGNIPLQGYKLVQYNDWLENTLKR